MSTLAAVQADGFYYPPVRVFARYRARETVPRVNRRSNLSRSVPILTASRRIHVAGLDARGWGEE